MRALTIVAMTIFGLVANFAQAGTMRKGLSTKEPSKIGYVEVTPSNTSGKFNIYFSADVKRYLIVDSESKNVEFSYADASALRTDILKTSLGRDAGVTIGCQEEEIRINAYINGCRLILPFEFEK